MAELESAAEGSKTETAVTQQGALRTGDLVRKEPKEGTNLELGHASRDNASLRPASVSGVTKEMKLFYTETFGPTISVLTVKTADEAFAIASVGEHLLERHAQSHQACQSDRIWRALNERNDHT